MSNLSNPSLSPIVSFCSTRTVWEGLSIEALEGTQGGLQGQSEEEGVDIVEREREGLREMGRRRKQQLHVKKN
jgi:hypothetical protein